MYLACSYPLRHIGIQWIYLHVGSKYAAGCIDVTFNETTPVLIRDDLKRDACR